MSTLHRVLNYVVKGVDFCCLCFRRDSKIALRDKIPVDFTKQNVPNFISFRDIVQYVLGDQMHEYVSAFANLCLECAMTLKSMYKFIRTTTDNAMHATEILNGLNINIQGTDYDNKSLFLVVNSKNYTTEHLYYTGELKSKTEALTMYQTLDTAYKKQDIRHLTCNDRISNNSPNNIKISDMLHDPKNPLHFKCKGCLRIYKSKDNLRYHFLRMHAPKVYKCPQCPKYFGAQCVLDIHFNNHCEGTCKECGKNFNNKSSLKRHELTHKSEQIVCPDCGRCYKTRQSFRNHIKFNVCTRGSSNNANDQFTCDYCNRKYTLKHSLRVHILHVHLKSYKSHDCEHCGKRFWSQSRLETHIVRHTEEKNFSCTMCPRKFARKAALLFHIRQHTNEKPFWCKECGATFASSEKKCHHYNTEHRNPIVECDICHCKFSRMYYLRKHKKKSHEPVDGTNVEQRPKNTAKKKIIIQKAKKKKLNKCNKQ